MFRTTNVGIGAWLTMHGHKPVQVVADPDTNKLVLYFAPSDEMAAQIHRYRRGGGPEETAVRAFNEARIRLSAMKPIGAGNELD